MIKIKLFSGGQAKCGFFLSFIFCGFVLTGCFSTDFQPSYKETDIPRTIKKICLEEYKLHVVPIRFGNTLWVYAPQQRLLHSEFGKNPDKIFDEALLDKARNILMSISRVLLSSDKAPEFFILVLSDINIGLDYSLTANFADIQKSASGGIPMMEANRRNVFNLEINPKAIGDARGEHLKISDTKMADFLSRQIVQRVRMFFQEDLIKKYLVLKDAEAGFKDGAFVFEYSVVKKAEPKEKLNISRNILDIITYCLKTYDFKDFSRVEIKDLLGEGSSIYESKDIWARSIE
jgi:hypothetical protein